MKIGRGSLLNYEISDGVSVNSGAVVLCGEAQCWRRAEQQAALALTGYTLRASLVDLAVTAP